MHYNFLYLFQNKRIFIIVHATTKWLKVFLVNSMLAKIVMNKFSEVIARFGISKIITPYGAKYFRSF